MHHYEIRFTPVRIYLGCNDFSNGDLKFYDGQPSSDFMNIAVNACVQILVGLKVCVITDKQLRIN